MDGDPERGMLEGHSGMEINDVPNSSLKEQVGGQH